MPAHQHFKHQWHHHCEFFCFINQKKSPSPSGGGLRTTSLEHIQIFVKSKFSAIQILCSLIES